MRIFVVTSIFLLKNLAIPPRTVVLRLAQSVPHFVRPAGIEPTSSVPKTDVLSVELRAQNYFLLFNNKIYYTLKNIFSKIALMNKDIIANCIYYKKQL